MRSGNARFNLAKLGATCRRLILDMYGPRTDALNEGTPTDRLIAEWAVDGAPRDPITTEDAIGLPRIIEEKETDRPYSHAPDATRVLLEIPADIAAKRAREPESALAWQVVVTNALYAYFEWGYRADGFVRWLDDTGHARCGYVLTRRTQDRH
jgi:predicted GNAT superfamily acetyltransferase